jgi:cytoskeletal protein RodZ
MMRICPKCGAYYADESSAFCLADGTPLASVDPNTENWSEGSRAIKEKENSLRKQKRRLKWRRIVMIAMTALITALVVTRSFTVERVPPGSSPSPTPSLSPSPSPTPSPSPSQSPSPDIKSPVTSTPTPTPVYKISGQVTNNGRPLNGVNVTLKGAKAASTATDENGNYGFTDLPVGGSYTITPDSAKTDFTPRSHSISKLTKDEAADFSALRPNFHQISGRVTDARGPLGGVKIKLEGSKLTSTTTDASGNYQFSDLPVGGSYTITPDSAKTDFTPRSHSISKLTKDEEADFATSGKRDPPPECINADKSREGRTIIDTFGDGWRKKIEGERTKIIADIKGAEATLGPLEYQASVFQGCTEALITVTYVWSIKTNNPAVPAKVVAVPKKKQFVCLKVFGRWGCR